MAEPDAPAYQLLITNPTAQDMEITVEHGGTEYGLGVVPAESEYGFPPMVPEGMPLTIVARATDGSREAREELMIRPGVRPVAWTIPEEGAGTP